MSEDADSPWSSSSWVIPPCAKPFGADPFAALDQRIALRFQLDPLETDQVAGYLTHHPRLCGRADAIFADDAVAAIAHAARGLPRQIGAIGGAAAA